MEIIQHIDIAASATQVWDVVGTDFAGIGRWASAIPSSTPIEDGRVCEVAGGLGVGSVVERLEVIDHAARTLRYRAAGLPSAVADASNTWTVTALDPGRSRVTIHARVTLSGPARLLTPLARIRFRTVGRRTLADLAHHVEQGVPTAAKQQQIAARTATAPLAVRLTRRLSASAEGTWAAVADAGDYARFADGIVSTEITGDHGEGMVRVCTDTAGGTWAETCTLWEEGQRYRMTVDATTYPWYHRALIAGLSLTWEVTPAPAGGSLLTAAVDGRMRLGPLGRRIGQRMAVRRLTRILDAYAAELDDDGAAGAPVTRQAHRSPSS